MLGVRRRPGTRSMAKGSDLARRISGSAALIAVLAATVGGCDGKIGSLPTDPAQSSATGSFELEQAVLPRLTAVQYRNVLIDLFGSELPATPVQPDTNPYLFVSIGATTTPYSELGVQQLEEAADDVTHAVFDDATRRAELVGCEPQAPGDACVAGFLESFGRRMFRRPLGEDEKQRWLGVAVDLADGDAWLGLRLAVAGMLQAPSFLYRVELGEPDPEDAARLRYTAYEMASRLSFLVWNSMPDEELLDAAELGDLHTPEGLEVQARRMLDDPRARAAVQEFFAEYFDLGRLDALSRNPELYPQFTPTMAESMRTEVKLLVDDLVNRRDADIRGVFSTRRTFVNSELAALYGVDAQGASPIAFVPVELPENGPRAGLLTLGAFLAMNAHETRTSPTLRGKYVRERVLCMKVPPPPPDVNTEIPDDPGEAKTLREKLEQHRKNPACASCHSFIDPPGFLFEHFDSAGAFRTTDSGYPIDASGELDGVKLAGARDLAKLLEGDERVGHCIVQQLYRHANGRLDAAGEAAALDQIDARFADGGYRFRELLVALVTHPSFRFLAQEAQP
jgi:uncharacterized protein DUF1592/uncharacterized protein DUF1588/uncharacterized protein DUF1595/uncharacterized protein DUF1585